MAQLIYGHARRSFPFEERTLSHVKIAIVSKLRRQESFLLSWDVPVAEGSGRMSVWISAGIPMAFEFSNVNPPALNPRWVEALLVTAARTGGMELMSEDEAERFLSEGA